MPFSSFFFLNWNFWTEMFKLSWTCKHSVFLLWIWQWKAQLYVGGDVPDQCFNKVFKQYEQSNHITRFPSRLHVFCPILSKSITHCWCWGLGTVDQRAPRHNLIHFHSNRFPLWDLILVSQYELWPWISTGLQLVFNVHQSSMWESSPHSGVLLTQPSPSRPTVGPSGPSQVPNHTSVSTVAKLFQSDWHPRVGEPCYKSAQSVTDHLGPTSSPHLFFKKWSPPCQVTCRSRNLD